MDLSDFLEQIRSHYVDAFADAIAAQVTDPAEWLVEAPFAAEGADLPDDPDADADDQQDLPLPMRHDLIPLENGEPGAVLVITPETTPDFEQLNLDLDGLPLILTPFTWDQCNVLAQGLPDDADFQPLVDWFDKWFDAEGTHSPDSRGLLNVIHALNPPEASEDGSLISFDLDLGSAPVEALLEFLSTLQAMGAEALAIGSSDEDIDGTDNDFEDNDDSASRS